MKKRNKKDKYVSHDKWPEIKKRLEREIQLNESFFEPVIEECPPAQDAFVLLDTLKQLKPAVKIVFCQVAYRILFQHYPVIKLKVSEPMFESWLITHSIDELKELIGYTDET